MADIQVYKRVVDYVGLGAKPIPERSLLLFKDLAPVLALLQGMGSDGAQLLQVDASGNLKVTTAAVLGPAVVQLQDDQSSPILRRQLPADLLAPTNSPSVTTFGELFNNVNWDRARSASAQNLGTLFSVGATLTAPPGEWSLLSVSAAGVLATVTKAAGAAGVRHVCRSIDFAAGSVVAPALTALQVNLRDGISGAGTILRSWLVIISAAVGQNVPPFGLTGLEIVGSAATAMTIEFSAALANLSQSVGMSGHDAS